jgi:threonylcarbamoyladenosine tRNA methylthiotransferase MtaB
MARKTTPKGYAQLISTARKAIPDVAITTDIIAGFPGESEDEFKESFKFVREMEFARGHVFTYSARPRTAAASMPDQIPYPTRKERNAAMRSMMRESEIRYRTRFLGSKVSVLWESATTSDSNDWTLSGLSDNYLRVIAQSQKRYWNEITDVELTTITDQGLTGNIV